MTPNINSTEQQRDKKRDERLERWLRISAPDDKGNDIKWDGCACDASQSFWIVLNVCRVNEILPRLRHNKWCNHSIWNIWINLNDSFIVYFSYCLRSLTVSRGILYESSPFKRISHLTLGGPNCIVTLIAIETKLHFHATFLLQQMYRLNRMTE